MNERDTLLRRSRTTLAGMHFRERIVWLNPFHTEHVTIRTDLAADACLEVLRAAIVSRYSPRTWFAADDQWPVMGAVSGKTFWIQRIHTLERPWLLQQGTGVVEPDGSGSVARVRIAMKPVNAVLVVAVGVISSVAALIAALWSPPFAPWPSIAWALWPLAGLAKYSTDRLWWAGDARYLQQFTVDALGASQRRPWHPYQSAS